MPPGFDVQKFHFLPTERIFVQSNLSNSKLKGPPKKIELFKNSNYESYIVSMAQLVEALRYKSEGLGFDS